MRAADGEVAVGRLLQLADLVRVEVRSTRVLALSGAWSVAEYTILSAACQICAKSRIDGTLARDRVCGLPERIVSYIRRP